MAAQEPGAGRQRVLLIAAAVLVVVAVLLAWMRLGADSPADIAANRAHKCIECGHEFNYTIKMGDKEPYECPKCDKLTVYRAEACYWTKDANGKWAAKLEPTYVVLKNRIDRTSTEKTYCPDCGREVKVHNPRPPQEMMDAARAAAGK
ncbi:MAG: hypothetical protein ABII12_07925 [Planctomycetota bacterium]